jgi:hypothetical protein
LLLAHGTQLPSWKAGVETGSATAFGQLMHAWTDLTVDHITPVLSVRTWSNSFLEKKFKTLAATAFDRIMARRTANEIATNGLNRLREQWRDPLLTSVTLLLALLMFVLVPLEAAGSLALKILDSRSRCWLSAPPLFCREI